jgi:CHAD domain-containing protein
MAYGCAVARSIHRRSDAAELSRRVLSWVGKVESRADVEDVHRLRTSIRRLEAQLGANAPAEVRKSLKALRRKAGKVRDLDVHLGLLKKPLFPAPGTKAEAGGEAENDKPKADPAQEKLQQILKQQRREHLDSLRERIADLAPLLRSRLPEVAEQLPQPHRSLSSVQQKAGRARQQYMKWTLELPVDDAGLHQLRIRAKKLRYAMEPLQEFEEAAALVARFKKVQDDIGLWHDWLTLEQLAVATLDPVEAADFLKALHDRCASQHRRALRTAGNVRRWMGAARKPVESASGSSAEPVPAQRVG